MRFRRPSRRHPTGRAAGCALALTVASLTACASTGAPDASATETSSTATPTTTAAGADTTTSTSTTAPTTSTTVAATTSTTAGTAAVVPVTTSAGTTTSTASSTPVEVDAEVGGAVTDAALGTGGSVDAPARSTDDARRIGEQIELRTPRFSVGTSVEGRPIMAERVGPAGGRKVLLIGVIHGNEDAGLQILAELRRRAIDERVELWVIDSMNPDGLLAQRRQNANGVDLNRNFPYRWGPIGRPGDSQYAGTGPASEPETREIVDFVTVLRPDIAIWYHQDANLIIPSTGRDGRIRARYAELTQLPLADCCDGGGIYTGIAATWARQELKKTSDAVPFIVELPGGELSPAQVTAHADAVITIGIEG